MPSPTDWRPFVNPLTGDWFPSGRAYYREKSDGTGFEILRQQDCEPIVRWNTARQNDGTRGYTPSRDLQHVARIPMVEIYRWIVEEGWDMRDPNASDKLRRRLNDRDFYKLRVGEGRV